MTYINLMSNFPWVPLDFHVCKGNSICLWCWILHILQGQKRLLWSFSKSPHLIYPRITLVDHSVELEIHIHLISHQELKSFSAAASSVDSLLVSMAFVSFYSYMDEPTEHPIKRCLFHILPKWSKFSGNLILSLFCVRPNFILVPCITARLRCIFPQ